MTPTGDGSTAGRATEGRTPFYGRVEDLVMVDQTQARLFTLLGRTPGLFRGLAAWPSLGEAFAVRSTEYHREAGAERWEAAGGV